ncbi:MAG: hypothetical protein ACKOD2_03110 [Ilumatobacteraceae bacterium]
MNRQERARAFAAKNAKRRNEKDPFMRKANREFGQRLAVRAVHVQKFWSIYPEILKPKKNDDKGATKRQGVGAK